jgi:hypothetical protein
MSEIWTYQNRADDDDDAWETSVLTFDNPMDAALAAAHWMEINATNGVVVQVKLLALQLGDDA